MELRQMKRQELVTHGATVLGVPRGTLLRATGESIIIAVESGNRDALKTTDGSSLFTDGVATSASPNAASDLAGVLALAIQPHLTTATDDIMAQVETLIDDKLSGFKSSSVTIEVKRENGETINVGRQHMAFPKLLTYLSAGLHVYLKGPAGSFKTTAAENAAKALDLPFYCQSMGPQTSQSQLLGYMDAHGKYVPGVLRAPYENGGALCLDEIDNSNASVLTVLNSALSNGYCAFPDGMVKRHERFVVVVTGNTYGNGADALYIGRQQLDAATLDRFVVIQWNYDEDFERDITIGINKDASAYLEYVRKCRKAIETLKLRVVVSPRASFAGARLMLKGVSQEDIVTDVIFKGVSADDRAKIEANL